MHNDVRIDDPMTETFEAEPATGADADADPGDPVLELDGVGKRYGPETAVSGLDLTVRDGELLTLLGPSGCGKTTTLRMIAGLEAPSEGTVTVADEAVAGDGTTVPPEERDVGMVFQEFALFPHLTVAENIAFGLEDPASEAAAERVAELLDLVGLGEYGDRTPGDLSGGQRQRVALARSLAADPAALLLDEPLANLDAPIKRRLRDELRPLLSSLSIPVVYVTHDQHEATVIGDRLAVVRDGAIQQCATPSEVFARPATPFVASFTGSTNLFRARIAEGESDPALEWAGHQFDVPDYEYPVGEAVWFCIRPEYVTVVDASGAGGQNVLDGRVRRRVFEGDGYRIDVVPASADDVLQVTLSPPEYERLELDDRKRVRLSLPRDAIHIVGECDRTDAGCGSGVDEMESGSTE